MSTDWNTLPLLPLRCILDQLSVENAMAAMSTCHHWRAAMALFEGHRDKLTLKTKEFEKNLFLTRIFRKHVTKLHIYIDGGLHHLENFMNYVLPQYFDSIQLQEVVFIGPAYLQSPFVPLPKLKRIITESLLFKNAHFLQKLAVMGCKMDSVAYEKDRYVHHLVEKFSKPLTFDSACVASPAELLLSRCNYVLMMFSGLKHIVFDYDQITTGALVTLSKLHNLSQLSLNVLFKRQFRLPVINWYRVKNAFIKVDVAVNIISWPQRQFKALIENVFVRNLPLTSLKIMFCKTLYIPLIEHVMQRYSQTLREFVCVDCPFVGPDWARSLKPKTCKILNRSVHPLIQLCWLCDNLRRLVIHGYWVETYDVVGFLRLRKSLDLELSSIYSSNSRYTERNDFLLRVMCDDLPTTYDPCLIQSARYFYESNWKPISWCSLPAGLKARSSHKDRLEYIIKEVLQPYGVT